MRIGLAKCAEMDSGIYILEGLQAVVLCTFSTFDSVGAQHVCSYANMRCGESVQQPSLSEDGRRSDPFLVI